MKKFNKKQIPNYISFFRIILIPIYVLTFFEVFRFSSLGALFSSGLIFILAGISDAIDGFLARRNNWITDVGKLLDPLADKLLEVTVAVCMSIRFGGPFSILAVIIIVKEFIMIFAAYMMMSKSNVYVSSVWCGKLATIVWYALLCVVHFFPAAEANWLLSYLLCVILILVMLLAFVIYAVNYASQIRSTKEELFKKKEK